MYIVLKIALVLEIKAQFVIEIVYSMLVEKS